MEVSLDFGTHTIIYVCSFFNLQHEQAVFYLCLTQVDQSAFIQNMTIKILKHQFFMFDFSMQVTMATV